MFALDSLFPSQTCATLTRHDELVTQSRYLFFRGSGLMLPSLEAIQRLSMLVLS